MYLLNKILNLLEYLKKSFNWKFEDILVLFLLYSLLIIAIIFNVTLSAFNEFPELAWSFVNGQLHFINPFNVLDNTDVIVFAQNIYWHLPPFPAIIMMPLAYILQAPPSQAAFSFIFNILLGLIIFNLTHKKFGFSKTNSIWLLILFFFSSVHINSVLFARPWHFSHLIASFLILLSLYEFFGKKRYWLIGLLIGFTFLSRFTAGLVVIFFLLIILTGKFPLKLKFKKLFLLFLPIFFCGLLLLTYNFLRFDNPLDNGYKKTYVYENLPEIHPYGQFSFKYIPQNIYYYFLESFQPIKEASINENKGFLLKFPFIKPYYWGCLSFFIVSPLFLLLFKSDLKNKIVKFSFITSAIILAIFLTYYYNGWIQIGPRYFNDFLPLLFIALLIYLQKKGLNAFYKSIIVISVFLNIYVAIQLVPYDLIRNLF